MQEKPYYALHSLCHFTVRMLHSLVVSGRQLLSRQWCLHVFQRDNLFVGYYEPECHKHHAVHVNLQSIAYCSNEGLQ